MPVSSVRVGDRLRVSGNNASGHAFTNGEEVIAMTPSSGPMVAFRARAVSDGDQYSMYISEVDYWSVTVPTLMEEKASLTKKLGELDAQLHYLSTTGKDTLDKNDYIGYMALKVLDDPSLTSVQKLDVINSLYKTN